MSAKIPFVFWAIFYYFVQYTQAQSFEVPGDLLQKYVNLTGLQLFQNCEERNMHCRAVITRDVMDMTEQINGNTLINLLVELVKKDPQITEKKWQLALDEHCNRDMSLKSLVVNNLKNFSPCIPQILASNKEGLNKFAMSYIPTYCSRIDSIARRRAGLQRNISMT